MIVLGIDPGLATTGYGIIKDNGGLDVLGYGVIQTVPALSRYLRLKDISKKLGKIIKKYKPDVAVVEKVFFNKNVKNAIITGEVTGAIILTCVNSNIKIAEYTPLEIKQGVVGYGRAVKSQVQIMMQVLLGLKEVPKSDDAADALAAALTYINSHSLDEKIEKRS